MKRILTLLCAVALVVSTASAWGRLGHATVAKIAENHFEGLTFNVYECKNEFFGHSVNVAGLLVGKDVYERLKEENL
ncbi:MAG: DUF512 domain-containing protein, partial [Alistipes sp.]|nr:DUF512 domain-containing protein [Alistipes sp.]